MWDDYGSPVERIAAADPRWSWKGRWTVPAKRESVRLANAKGAEAAVTFEGTGFILTGTYLQTGGKLDVYLDDKPAETVDVYLEGEGERSNESIFHRFGLARKHSVRLVVRGEPYEGSSARAQRARRRRQRPGRFSMNILLFGATGMVGQGVLRECLLAPDVQLVETVGRSPTGVQHPKLREIVHPDLFNFSAPIEADLSGFDACFFCLGVTSAGMKEADYEKVTYGITMAAATTLSRLNSQMTFIYVSGAGTDSSERGRSMWARVKGKTENALLRLPFKAASMFRPGIIQPLHGVKSKTGVYRFFYALAKPLLPALRWALPAYVLTTEDVGQAMLAVARSGAPKCVLESKDIRDVLTR